MSQSALAKTAFKTTYRHRKISARLGTVELHEHGATPDRLPFLEADRSNRVGDLGSDFD